jgi:hypothetical protein
MGLFFICASPLGEVCPYSFQLFEDIHSDRKDAPRIQDFHGTICGVKFLA